MNTRMRTRFVAILLAIIIALSGFPVNVFAVNTGGDTQINVENVTAFPGSTIDVDVTISNNPGILGAVLTLTYDPDLTLTGVTQRDAFSPLTLTKPGVFQSPCNFSWDGQDILPEDIKDGVIMTLTFDVSETAESDTTKSIRLSATPNGVVDPDTQPIAVNFVAGTVTITDYMPGDVNGDSEVNSSDIILLRRHMAGGYNVSINESAGNVNGDRDITISDVIYIRRAVAGGYGVVLLPSPGLNLPPELEHVVRKEATCREFGNIEYWFDSANGKYYSDASAINEITIEDTVIAKAIEILPAVAPTETTTGLTEGVRCTITGEILVPQEVIPKLQGEQHAIQYVLHDNDPYLMGIEISNPNADTYTSNDGLLLQPLAMVGYEFDGWYDGPGEGGKYVPNQRIATGNSGTMYLYARWTPIDYMIQFDSPLYEVSSTTYNVSTGMTLQNPVLEGYNFVGWSNDQGELVSRIEPGSIGHMTLKANWTSRRNLTRPVDELADPIVHHDTINNQILFAYKIGTMENVPLAVIRDLGNKTEGIAIEETITQQTITIEQESDTIAQAISRATTTSSSMTLSSEWNNVMEKSEEHKNEVSLEQFNSTQGSQNASGNYYVSASAGKATNTVEKEGSSSKFDAGIEAEASWGLPLAGELEINAHVNYEHNSYEDKTTTTDTYWNTNASKSDSYDISSSHETATTLNNAITDTYGIKTLNSEGGSEQTSESTSVEQGNVSEYSSTLSYSTENVLITERSISNANAPAGYYRIVASGKLHVFAVVTYDIASSAYGIYTYSVIDENVGTFIDYSRNTPSFDDYENGVLPFEVPYEVNEYVDAIVGQSEGLVFDSDTGMVVDYLDTKVDGTPTSDVVIIPEYATTSNTSTDVFKVTGISPNAFKGNTRIIAVKLPSGVTEIPDSAFEGCTNLEAVSSTAVTDIGDNAFSGCTSLLGYNVDANVTSLGSNAFNGVSNVTVTAISSAVANAAVASGAKSLTLNMGSLTDTYSGQTIQVPDTTESFVFNGSGKDYSGVKIFSDATSTEINDANLINNYGTVLKLSSDDVSLADVNVQTTGWALALTKVPTEPASPVNVKLYRTVNLVSSAEDAFVSGDVIFSRSNPYEVGKLNVTGNMLVYGDVIGDESVTVTGGRLTSIAQAEYDEIISAINANTFDIGLNANGGTVSQPSVTLTPNEPIGTLPTPTREGYIFQGWYTANEGGTVVTETTIFPDESVTVLFARWVSNAYSINWNNTTGVNITVTRTESPYANAGTGAIGNGATIYYGDKLTVSYSAATGYTLTGNGTGSIVVDRAITAADIYGTARANTYAYSVVYRSSNGTSLGSTSVTKTFGTTNLISAPAKSGYNTPAAQSVHWNATSKTITFTYTPSAVGNTTRSGRYTSSPVMDYSAVVELGTRTANTIQVRVSWTTTLEATGFASNQQILRINNDTSTNTAVVKHGVWGNSSSSARSSSGTTKWITLNVGTTAATSVSLPIFYYQANYNGTYQSANSKIDATWSIPVPAF